MPLKPKCLLPCGIVLCWGILMLGLALGRQPVACGGDEGYECMKGLLVRRGYPLYSQIWTDQPPLYTYVLAALYGVFGEDVRVGRALSSILSTGFLGALLFLMQGRLSSTIGLTAAVLCLTASPQFAELSISSMVELPMTAVIFVAAACARSTFGARPLVSCLLAGILTGLALGIKLMAVLFFPLVACEILMGPSAGNLRRNKMLVWLGSTCFVFTAIWMLSPGISWAALLSSHFGSVVSGHAHELPALSWSVSSLWGVGVIAGLGGVVLAIQQRVTRRVALPVVSLLALLAFHYWYRPFWGYYLLHFAPFVAWLCGAAAEGLSDIIQRALYRAGPFQSATIAMCCLGLSVLLVSALTRSASQVAQIARLPTTDADPVLTAIRRNAIGVKWIYTDQPIYAFHAGVLIPPPLAVVPIKRWVTGQMDYDRLEKLVRQFRPELIVLFRSSQENLRLERSISDEYTCENISGVNFCKIGAAPPRL